MNFWIIFLDSYKKLLWRAEKRKITVDKGVKNMPTVFLVEDDAAIRSELSLLLNRYGYECITSDDYAHMADVILQAAPQLVLLDINLPVCDGYCICRELRRRSQIPVIIVTSRDSDADELISMNLGADDFITKPYNTQILLARIAAVMKRAYPTAPPQILEHRGLQLNISRSEARCGDKTVELTKNEMKILHMLISRRGQIVTRAELMNALWQTDEFVDDNTLTVNVNRLRKKLEDLGLKDYLITKRGQGYLV
jgi:DNA-binding response OmpR family regulator